MTKGQKKKLAQERRRATLEKNRASTRAREQATAAALKIAAERAEAAEAKAAEKAKKAEARKAARKERERQEQEKALAEQPADWRGPTHCEDCGALSAKCSCPKQ